VEGLRFASDGHVQHLGGGLTADVVGAGAVDVDRFTGGAGGQQQDGQPGEGARVAWQSPLIVPVMIAQCD